MTQCFFITPKENVELLLILRKDLKKTCEKSPTGQCGLQTGKHQLTAATRDASLFMASVMPYNQQMVYFTSVESPGTVRCVQLLFS